MDGAALPGWDELYELAPCGLLVAGAKGNILHANTAMCRGLQYSREALTAGMRFQDLLTMGGRIFHQTHLAPLLRMQGTVGEVKLDLKRSDGTVVPMMLNLAERPGPRGDVLLYVAGFVAEDRVKYERELLAQRRHAEQLAQQHARDQSDLDVARGRLRLAMESAKLFAWEVDPSTGERRYEEGAARLLGYSGPLAVDPSVFLEAIHPEDRAGEQAALEQALRGDEEYHCTFRLRGLDKHERIVSSWGRAFFDASGKLVQFTGLLQDVTPAG